MSEECDSNIGQKRVASLRDQVKRTAKSRWGVTAVTVRNREWLEDGFIQQSKHSYRCTKDAGRCDGFAPWLFGRLRD